MKKNHYYLLLIILFLVSCSGNKRKEKKEHPEVTAAPEIQKDSFPKSVLIRNIISRKNPSNSYSLYLPHQYGDSAKLPAFIFFDPHADGSVPLNKYKELSEKFGVVMIGSNDSKNELNFEQTNSIAQSLTEEVKERFSVDPKQISLCGFSGGAKVALVAAMSMQGVSSVVYCGAGLPPQQITALPPTLGFAGVRDLNYTEVIETDETLQSKNNPHAIVEWNGKHEWPDSVSFQDAFYWIGFRAMENKAAPINSELVNEFKKRNGKIFPNILDEWWRLKKMIAFLNGVSDVSQYVSANEVLIKKKEFATAIEKQKNEMDKERQIKQSYYDAVEQRDLNWWKTEIDRLRGEKGAAAAMNQRLLGYISLMCYSLSNTDIKQGNLAPAEKILTIYKLADPDNPDQAYLQACFYALNNNKDAAIISLKEAMRLGFNDKNKVMQDEAFASLHNTAEFNELVK